jgi:hypothetical protein
VSNPFANWKPHDVDAHNQRVQMKTARQHNAAQVGEAYFIKDATGQDTAGPVKCEADLHSQIFNECRRRGWIAFHGSMSERTHRTLGEPDFTILADAGRLLMVECKARKEKPSLEQNAMIVHAKKLGHEIHVVWSFKEFLAII